MAAKFYPVGVKTPKRCTDCGGDLSLRNGALVCEECGGTFDFIGPAAVFTDPDPFYSEPIPRWDHPGPSWILPFVDAGITRFLSRWVPKGRVLDIGCGAGLRFLSKRAEFVAGVDLSPARLEKAAEIYDEVYLADITNLPFHDGSFDAVVSVDLLEHIPIEAKDAVIGEMIRVTRPGGRLVHLLDCASEKPLHRWARIKPDLYQRHFVEKMGHIGLEKASDALRRFRSFPLSPLEERPVNRTILQWPENFAWQFDNEYLEYSRRLRLLTSLSYFIRRHPAVRAGYSGLLELVWHPVFDRLRPVDHAFNLFVAYEVRS